MLYIMISYHCAKRYIPETNIMYIFCFQYMLSACQSVRMEEIVQDLLFVSVHKAGLETGAIEVIL